MDLRSVCIFAGSSPGALGDYAQAARSLGRLLARRQVRVVYGGGAVGLMGEVAGAALQAGGEVIGVIPKFLVDREVAKADLSRLEVVDTMHQRKLRMFDLSDAFVALPGGLGTLEETFEMLTWAQLGRHRKACGLLNVAGYYDGLLQFLDHSVTQRFVRAAHRGLLQVGEDPEALLDAMAAAPPDIIDKWLDR